MQKYKVDWLAFSVSFEDEEQTLDPQLLKMLGYDLADFDEIPGRFFYNSGATYRNYVNVFWNDADKKIHKNSSKTMTVVFTGQGSTELAEKWDTDWVSIFQTLKDYGGVNFTRIDLAFDDYDEVVRFSKIEEKLKKGIIVHLVSPTISLKHQTKMANHWVRQFTLEMLGRKMGAVGMCMLVFMTKRRNMRVRTNYFQPKFETIGRGLGKKFGNGMRLAILRNTLKRLLMSF